MRDQVVGIVASQVASRFLFSLWQNFLNWSGSGSQWRRVQWKGEVESIGNLPQAKGSNTFLSQLNIYQPSIPKKQGNQNVYQQLLGYIFFPCMQYFMFTNL